MTIKVKSLVWLAGAALLAMGTGARADEVDAAARSHAQRIAIRRRRSSRLETRGA